jgi:hypothetical protein
MARLYLLQFDLESETHVLLDSAEWIVDGVPVHTELLYLRGGTVYSISYTDKLFACDIVDNKFVNMRSWTVTPGEAYHGICDGGAPDCVYVTNMRANTITQFNVRTGKKKVMTCGGGVRMKDVALIGDDLVAVLSSDRGPINTARNPDGSIHPINSPYDGHVLLYNRHTGQRKDVHRLKDTQIDGCTYANNKVWVTCTDTEGHGFLWSATVADDDAARFTEKQQIPCASFPHGIAIHGDMLAYTSYGDSSLIITRI